MGKLKVSISFLFALASMSSCVKNSNDEIVYTGKSVEIDAASWNANAVSVTYPILTRRVPDNRAVNTGVDSTLRRLNGSTRVRINMVGPQSDREETVGYKIFTSPITSVSFPSTLLFSSMPGTAGRQEPAQAAATLSVIDAVAGTHYTALSGKVTIPAKSSFGYIDIVFQGPSASQARFIGIQLDSTGTVLPAVGYNRVGLVIDQR